MNSNIWRIDQTSWKLSKGLFILGWVAAAQRRGRSPPFSAVSFMPPSLNWSTPIQFRVGSYTGRTKEKKRKNSNPPETLREAKINWESGTSSKNKARGVSAHISLEISMKHSMNPSRWSKIILGQYVLAARVVTKAKHRIGGCLARGVSTAAHINLNSPTLHPTPPPTKQSSALYTDRCLNNCPSTGFSKKLLILFENESRISNSTQTSAERHSLPPHRCP